MEELVILIAAVITAVSNLAIWLIEHKSSKRNG